MSGAQPGPEISVVIATKDRARYLTRALESLAAQHGAPPFETLVVDNGSRDDTAAVIRAQAADARLQLVALFEARPNRAAARNRALAVARGALIVFVDDDVVLPAHFLASHAAAHDGLAPRAVSGPIINVPDYETRPRPVAANASRAFFCTCNVSVPRGAVESAGRFDETFALYGWEDTDLGLRLRNGNVRRAFAWDAFLYHIKPPSEDSLERAVARTIEKGRMAAMLVRKHPTLRARLATGAFALNRMRGALLAPGWALPIFAGVAASTAYPPLLRSIARGRLLDGIYLTELVGSRGHEPDLSRPA